MREYSNTKILDEKAVLQAIRQRSHPIVNISGLNTLMDRIGDARIVMLGIKNVFVISVVLWKFMLNLF